MILLSVGFRITQFPHYQSSCFHCSARGRNAVLSISSSFTLRLAKVSCDLFGTCPRGSKIVLVLSICMRTRVRVLRCSPSTLGCHRGIERGHKEHGQQWGKGCAAKRGQEISASLVSLPACRSLPKITAYLGGAPLAGWESLHPAL